MSGYLHRASRVLYTVSFFSSLIDRCSPVGSPSNSRLIHAHLIKLGFSSNTFLANRCIDLYIKCGCAGDALKAFYEVPNKNVFSWNLYLRAFVECFGVESARKVFDEMPEKDAVSWNTMISGYVSNGFLDNGWELFFEMKGCVRWTDFTFSIMLSCVESGNHAKEMHGCLMRNAGCYSNLVVGNSLIDAYGKLGHVDYALSVFLSMEKVDVISWNSMISAFCNSGKENLALQQLCLMGSRGFKVDEYTLSALLSAASKLRNLERGKQMFGLCVKMGFLWNTVVSSSAIDMFSKCNRLESAIHVFKESYALDAAICSSMIACYSNHNLEENALEIFVTFFRGNIRPTEFTLSCVIHSAAAFFPVEQGSQLHSLVIKTGLESDGIVASSLIEMYGKHGLSGAALNIFSDMIIRDLIAWNTMILALTYGGKFVEAVHLFDKLLQSGLQPDCVTFSSVLLACRYGRLLEEGMAIFYAMEKQYGVSPINEHYAYVVDMMIRGGRINEAINLLQIMKCEPNALMWESILCVCGEYGNLELIERVAERMMEFEPHSSLPYLVLDHIYEQMGRWERLVRVRRKMLTMMSKEVVDCSWIGVKGFMFSFEENQMIHHCGKEVFSVLGLLMQEIWGENYSCFE